MFSYQLPTRSANQVVRVSDTDRPDELQFALPNGEVAYIKATEVQAMLHHFKPNTKQSPKPPSMTLTITFD